MNKDDHCLSSLAGLGIILVVFGHSEPFSEYALRQYDSSTGAWPLHQVIEWIYTFHMPLFFAMAGYAYVKFTAPKGQGLLQFLRIKTERLLLPIHCALQSRVSGEGRTLEIRGTPHWIRSFLNLFNSSCFPGTM